MDPYAYIWTDVLFYIVQKCLQLPRLNTRGHYRAPWIMCFSFPEKSVPDLHCRLDRISSWITEQTPLGPCFILGGSVCCYSTPSLSPLTSSEGQGEGCCATNPHSRWSQKLDQIHPTLLFWFHLCFPCLPSTLIRRREMTLKLTTAAT